jgi:hypothetical protein
MAIAESESISGLHPMEYRLHEDNNYEADRVRSQRLICTGVAFSRP